MTVTSCSRRSVRFSVSPDMTARTRAMFVMSVMPPCFTSSVSALLPLDSTTASFVNPVGGREPTARRPR